MNTACLLSIPSTMFPGQEILVFEGMRLTYSQVQDRVDRLSKALRNLGMGRASRIGVLQTNCNQYVETYYATSKLGGVFVPLSCRASSEELTYMINAAQVDALLVGERYVDLALSLRWDLPSVKQWIALDRRRRGMLFFDDLVSVDAEDEAEEDMQGDETSMVMYTSGTKGLPKAVMLSYRNFVEYILESVEPADGTRWGATLLCAPLHHIAGAMTMLTSIYSGRRLVLMKWFDGKEWLRLAQHERVTHAFLLPAMLKRLLDEAELARSDLDALETLSYGGAPMPVSIIQRAIDKLPKKVGFINAFGQTETTSTVTMLLPEDHRQEGSPGELEKKLRRLGSVGRPLPDVELKIVDEKGQEVQRGEIGEITLRTRRLMKGYIGQEGLARGILVDGWMRSRDLGWMDEDCYVFLAGRKEEPFIPADKKLAHDEIEEVILYSGMPSAPTIQTRTSGGSLRVSVQTSGGCLRANDLVCFLTSLYESLEMDELQKRYLCAVPSLVDASAYGFYLLEAEAVRPSWPVGPDAGDDGFDRDEELRRVLELQPGRTVRQQEPGQGSMPVPYGWRNLLPLEWGDARQLGRVAWATMRMADGRFLGVLSFGRTHWQPAFDSADLRTIQLVAHHMSVVVGHALKYAEVRERSSLAEAALQVVAPAVLLSDEEGRIKFTNVRAQKLLEQSDCDPALKGGIVDCLRDNLSDLQTAGKRVATRTLRLPKRTFAGHNCLVLRSTRIPSARRTVATFLYSQSIEQAPDFQHLTSLLTKREIEVLLLLARGMPNKEIAETLVVTTNTVKHHLKQMFFKMQVSSRSELLGKAFLSSLVS